MTTTADVLVIGGGIAGIGVAARLASDMKVIVLERETAIGTQSSGRSAAIFVQNYGNATLRMLSAASRPVFDSEELSETPLLTERGEMAVGGPGEEAALDRFVADGSGLERLTAAEALSLVPILRPEKVAAAAIEPDARDIDVDALMQGFARLLRSNGGVIETGVAISSIRRTAHWRVETAHGAFEAPILVNAAGAWADQLALLAGAAPVGLVPMRRSAAILPAPDHDGFSRWPMAAAFDESWYFKPQSGKLLVSPSEEDAVEPHDTWPDDLVLAEGLDRFAQATTYELARVERSWAGLRTFAPDKTPVVGFDPEAKGFFWLAGQGGYGIQTSPALSQLSADLILGKEAKLSDEVLTALSPRRFRDTDIPESG